MNGYLNFKTPVYADATLCQFPTKTSLQSVLGVFPNSPLRYSDPRPRRRSFRLPASGNFRGLSGGVSRGLINEYSSSWVRFSTMPILRTLTFCSTVYILLKLILDLVPRSPSLLSCSRLTLIGSFDRFSVRTVPSANRIACSSGGSWLVYIMACCEVSGRLGFNVACPPYV